MKIFILNVGVVLFALCVAAAQTPVTTSGGTANTVPKFSGSSTIVNSVITETNGHMGIGTANPATDIHIQGTDATTLLRLDLSRADTGRIWDLSPFIPGFKNSGFAIRDTTAGINRIIIDGDTGNVGIGANDPGARLHVLGGDNATMLRLDFTPANTGRAWDLVPYIPGFQNSGFAIRDTTAGTNRIIIDGDNGSVGINMFPGVPFDVNGVIRSNAGFMFPDGSLQTKAQAVGPQGPQGPQGVQGPPGPPTHTSAVCIQAPHNTAQCSCAIRLVLSLRAPDVVGGSSCQVTSDTGSCSASGNFSSNGSDFSGACCVCGVQ